MNRFKKVRWAILGVLCSYGNMKAMETDFAGVLIKTGDGALLKLNQPAIEKFISLSDMKANFPKQEVNENSYIPLHSIDRKTLELLLQLDTFKSSQEIAQRLLEFSIPEKFNIIRAAHYLDFKNQEKIKMVLEVIQYQSENASNVDEAQEWLSQIADVEFVEWQTTERSLLNQCAIAGWVKNLMHHGLYDANQQSFREIKKNDKNLKNITLSPDGGMIAVFREVKFGVSKELDVYDSQGRIKAKLRKYLGNTWAFSWDNKFLAGGGFDSVIPIWDLESGKCIKKLKNVNTLMKRVDKYERSLGDCSLDDPNAQELLNSQLCIDYFCKDRVKELAFSPNGQYLAVLINNDESGIKVWSLRTKNCIYKIRYEGKKYGISFSPDEDLMVVEKLGGLVIKKINIAMANQSKILSESSHQHFSSKQKGAVNGVTGLILMKNSENNLIMGFINDMQKGVVLKNDPTSDPAIENFCISADGSTAAYTTQDSIKIIDVLDKAKQESVKNLGWVSKLVALYVLNHFIPSNDLIISTEGKSNESVKNLIEQSRQAWPASFLKNWS